MGTLKIFKFNLNDPEVVQSLLSSLRTYVRVTQEAYYTLKHKSPYYFAISDEPITTDPGWYIILDGNVPVYVGTAENLNKRLNSNNGSTDNFGKTKRNKDCERNFIKKFTELKVITDLRVVIIPETVVDKEKTTKEDREEIEKLINIFRSSFEYIATPNKTVHRIADKSGSR